MKDKVLCIDDDQTIQSVVVETLKDFEVTSAFSLKEASEAISKTRFNALLVDIRLPDGDGLRYLTQIMQNESVKGVPILIFSEHSAIANKVMAFSYGAEDFIAKPFDPIELRARVAAKIKKSHALSDDVRERRVGDIVIDFDRQKVIHISENGGADLALTAIELKILTLLTKRFEQVYARDQIMDIIWGNTYISDRTVDSHIAHLRQKISNSKIKIETVKSFGYKAVLKE